MSSTTTTANRQQQQQIKSDVKKKRDKWEKETHEFVIKKTHNCEEREAAAATKQSREWKSNNNNSSIYRPTRCRIWWKNNHTHVRTAIVKSICAVRALYLLHYHFPHNNAASAISAHNEREREYLSLYISLYVHNKIRVVWEQADGRRVSELARRQAGGQTRDGEWERAPALAPNRAFALVCINVLGRICERAHPLSRVLARLCVACVLCVLHCCFVLRCQFSNRTSSPMPIPCREHTHNIPCTYRVKECLCTSNMMYCRIVNSKYNNNSNKQRIESCDIRFCCWPITTQVCTTAIHFSFRLFFCRRQRLRRRRRLLALSPVLLCSFFCSPFHPLHVSASHFDPCYYSSSFTLFRFSSLSRCL